ncbi:MAG: DNA repair protein RecO [Lachnospiraceae bacterium]|nr:DNA repair protein RecO [Lachnospiraceae bacterium]
MRDYVPVTGMILETFPAGDYDRRLVMLTTDRGKITVFARGARRTNSKMMAATNPFCFGRFKLYEGKNAYNLIDADIDNYFEELREDFMGAYLGMYFLEYASYYGRENNDDSEMLKLLYQAIRAIIKESLDNRLIRAVFELKILAVNGEFPGIPDDRRLNEATVYTIEHIINSPVNSVFNFRVSDRVLAELTALSNDYRKRYTDHHFRSLDTLDSLNDPDAFTQIT